MTAKQLLESRKRGLLDKTDVVNLSDALLAIEMATLEGMIVTCHFQEIEIYKQKLHDFKIRNGIED